ncbi:ribose-phosphate diphosphokinase [Leisingera aquaemixtae]|uniref:Ribose-phosphate pyrophosphokinase n=1 Tax=Leisingera aquaemixtae TaxID=1396826 RepID=A0A0N7M415_9RHOB|nr:ribose-phosphate diphosphokinase [Leisingera aquaemixtae]CUH98370.1 Ribose-phosphate pyrophosphokinase [Leisingera aquaemixtae]
MRPVLIPFHNMRPLADQLAALIGAEVAPVDWHRFPDGESRITLHGDLEGRESVILCSLCDPDRHAMPLRFAADTAREMGAVHAGLIAPYLGYMRQDRRFHSGEAVSARLFARFLEESFDWLVTVDPHLHRIQALDELFAIPAGRVSAAPLLAQWIAETVENPVLVGPDRESRQWVAEVASLVGCPYEVLRKVRSGDRRVEVSNSGRQWRCSGTPVLVDDIASSGRTLVGAIERLVEAGAKPPLCAVIHAVFAGQAHAEILAAGASQVVTTDTIPHESNAIGIAPLLAEAAIHTLTALTLQ